MLQALPADAETLVLPRSAQDITELPSAENGVGISASPPATLLATVEELTLMSRVAAGDERAVEQLVRTYAPRMQAIARRMIRCEQDADDAVQDALISIVRRGASFTGGSRLWTWLHRVTANAALMRLRTAGNHNNRHTSIESLLPTFLEDGHHARSPTRWPDDAFDRLSRAETSRAVRDAIDELPPAYREVLLLRDIEELDTDVTATLLNTTPGNIKTRLHRARQALRTILTGRLISSDH